MNGFNKIDVSWMTYIRLIIVLAGLWLIWILKDVIYLLILVLIIVAAISPIVKKMSKIIPRMLAPSVNDPETLEK